MTLGPCVFDSIVTGALLLWQGVAVGLGRAFALLGQEPGGGVTGDIPPINTSDVDFQRYIFWAYALACILIFLATLWSIAQAKRLEKRLEYLERRFSESHPEVAGGS